MIDTDEEPDRVKKKTSKKGGEKAESEEKEESEDDRKPAAIPDNGAPYLSAKRKHASIDRFQANMFPTAKQKKKGKSQGAIQFAWWLVCKDIWSCY